MGALKQINAAGTVGDGKTQENTRTHSGEPEGGVFVFRGRLLWSSWAGLLTVVSDAQTMLTPITTTHNCENNTRRASWDARARRSLGAQGSGGSGG